MQEGAVTTLSSKHQITLPMGLVRALHLEPGDKLAVRLEGSSIVLRPQPRDWVAYLAGSLAGSWGRTRQEVEAYLAEVRGEWGTYLAEGEEAPSENN